MSEAIALFEQAARQAPPSALVLNHLGNAYQDVGDQVTAKPPVLRQAVASTHSSAPCTCKPTVTCSSVH